MRQFELGQRVRGGPRLWRRTDIPGRRDWRASSWDKRSVEGIYIGWRTYMNGILDVVDYVFKRDQSIKVALIVPGPRQNPIPVMFDTVELIE